MSCDHYDDPQTPAERAHKRCKHCGMDNGRHNGACPERFAADITQIKADLTGICARVTVLEKPEGDTLRKLQKDAAKSIQLVINDWGPMPVLAGSSGIRFYEYKEAYNRWLFGPGALDVAWSLLANAYNGDWSKCARSWQVSARDWEQRWHAFEKPAPTFRNVVDKVEYNAVVAERDKLKNKIELLKAPQNVKRWSFGNIHSFAGYPPRFYEDPNGEWVRFSDIQWSTPVVQAAVIAGQGDKLAEAEKMIAAQDAQTKAVMKERDLLKNEVERLTSALETERAVNKHLLEQLRDART